MIKKYTILKVTNMLLGIFLNNMFKFHLNSE